MCVTSIGFTTKNRIFTPFWYQNCKKCKVVLPIKLWIWLKYSWNLLMCQKDILILTDLYDKSWNGNRYPFAKNIFYIWKSFCHLDMANSTEINLWSCNLGAEFVVPFFSSSWPLALKMSLQSHQMTSFFIQDEYWENDDVFLVKSSLFWMRKVVIWWLFDDELRARVQEQEKKRTINSTSKGQLKVNNQNCFFLLGFNGDCGQRSRHINGVIWN